jgi:hypothetical protein
MSDACLSRAAATAAVTAFGSFAGPDRARVVAGFAGAAFEAVSALEADTAFEADIVFEDALVFVVLRALAGDALVFAMQVVYRSVQMMRKDVPRDRRRHEIIDPLVGRKARADLGRGHVARVGVDGKYPGFLRVRHRHT